MKKFLSLILACFVAFSLVGCSNEKKEEKPAEGETVKNALELLTKTWDAYPEADKFASIGGDFNNMTDNAPGELDHSDKEILKSLLIVPEASAEMIDQAASLMHAMNANTFTSGAFHIADAKNTTAFADALKEAILTNKWMCGFPEQLILIQVNEDFIVSAFGNADMINTFKTTFTEQYPSAKVIAEETF